MAAIRTIPNKPIRFLVPFIGGVADVYARIIGQKLTEAWGQPVVIDNRPGAGGLIATEIAVQAPANGYTVLIGIDGTFTINPSLYRKLPYDPVKDFVPITQVLIAPLILVSLPSLPAQSVKELIALEKSKPGQFNYGSPATGNAGHLAGEMFNSMTGTKFVHVPYKGGASAVTALLTGEVTLVFSNAGVALPYVKAGRLRALAVSSRQRLPVMPDLPTIAEAGVPGYEAGTWTGVFSRAGTPRDIQEKLTDKIISIVRRPEIQEGMINQGIIPVGNTPQEFAAYMKVEAASYAKVIRELGIRAD